MQFQYPPIHLTHSLKEVKGGGRIIHGMLEMALRSERRVVNSCKTVMSPKTEETRDGQRVAW